MHEARTSAPNLIMAAHTYYTVLECNFSVGNLFVNTSQLQSGLMIRQHRARMHE